MRRYPEYKDIKQEWLGHIPTHWEITKVKYFSTIINGATPDSNNHEYWNGDIVWLTPDDIGKLNGNPIADSKRKITELGLNNCGTTITPPNSIVISTRAPIGHIAITSIPTCTNQGCKTIILNHRISDFRFIYYYIYANKNVLQSFGQGSTFTELSSQNLKDFPVVFPSLSEQVLISAFLDKKTSQIDSLIEKKKRLIELLKEYRTAIINHAVTKGLDPNVKMKDSGIEWIGQIPEHWEVVKHKRFVDFKNGVNFTAEKKGKGLLMLDVLNMYGESHFVDFRECYRVDIDVPKDHILTDNDFLFVRSSLKKEGVGWTSVFNGYKEPVSYCGFIIRSRLKNTQINPSYLAYFFRSESGRNSIISESNTVTITNLSQESLGDVIVTLPPYKEQETIANSLTVQCELLDSSIKKQTGLITGLLEYRDAIISDTVTGKIDVRDEVEQESEQAKKWAQD